MLVARLGATHVSVGENFHFGNRAQGDAALLRADERFETRVAPLLEVDGEIVSSSHIRGLVAGGALEYAGTLLGTPFVVDGPVEHGDKRGRDARLPDGEPRPARGLRAPGARRLRLPRADRRRRWHAAATNVGVRPMFETGLGELIEAYLLDFDGDLYGQPLRVEFLRAPARREALRDASRRCVEQMARDVEATRMVAGLP